MRALALTLAMVATSSAAQGAILERGKVQLICHRTANRDIPENTLESLAYAARMGCNVVELDIRTTLDGTLVLHHDGYLERLSDGIGDVSATSFDELELLDAGGWMTSRFRALRVPRFDEALRLARSLNIGLDLDIKVPGEGAGIFAALNREGMVERVIFGGDDHNADDLRSLMPIQEPVTWLGPTATAREIGDAHAQGKFTVANFSANPHEMDLQAMRSAVANGIDAINVDYPRLGADAVGRPVEDKVAKLAHVTRSGNAGSRLAAIRELAQYQGFPTEHLFTQLMYDPDSTVSHAAALALVLAQPQAPTSIFLDALASASISAQTNAAWALGMLHATATAELIHLLKQADPSEVKEVLLALSRCPGQVSASVLLPFLDSPVPMVRGTGALALARHQPEIAAKVIPALLKRDEQASAADYATYVQHGKYKLSQPEIDVIIERYREQMKLVHAIEMLPSDIAAPILTTEAFRVAEDPSHVISVFSGYGLWDLLGSEPASTSVTIAELNSTVPEVADRAEWMLVKGGSADLPAVRAAVSTSPGAVRVRLIHVLAWQGDAAALPLLRTLQTSSTNDRELLSWAIGKIEMLQFSAEAEHAN